MDKKNIISSLVVSIVVVAIALTVFGGNTTVEKIVDLGSGSGQNTDSRQFFQQGASFGGVVSTTTTATTYTTLARDFNNTPSVISWLPNINTTVSISSTSTLPYVPNVGDTATVYLRNASTTAAASITVAAKDAGLDMQFAEATGGDLVLNGLDWAKLTIIHTSTNLVTVIFDEMTEAD